MMMTMRAARTLCPRHDGGLEGRLVDIVAAQHVCDEDAVELGLLQHGSKIDPVVDLVEAP